LELRRCVALLKLTPGHIGLAGVLLSAIKNPTVYFVVGLTFSLNIFFISFYLAGFSRASLKVFLIINYSMKSSPVKAKLSLRWEL
jgi:hypothetical protein